MNNVTPLFPREDHVTNPVAAANSMLHDFNLRVMQEAETLTDDLTNQIFTVRTQDIQADIFFANKAKKD